nr:hypothetical protein SUGSMm_20740 [Morganella morganii subsp. sibonii]
MRFYSEKRSRDRVSLSQKDNSDVKKTERDNDVKSICYNSYDSTDLSEITGGNFMVYQAA